MKRRGGPRPSWTAQEKNLLKRHYEVEGADGCIARMKKLARRGPVAVKVMARSLGLRSPLISQALARPLSAEQIEEVIRLHDEEGLGFKVIGVRFGVAEGTAANAYWSAQCRRRGYRPARRDARGHLLPAEVDRLREFLRKGTKPVDIQLFMAISAACIAQERRQYNTELKARGKRPLPPPGGGVRYSGAKIDRDSRREVERLYLEGWATPKVSAATGVSKTHCLRTRSRLVRRLRRKGESLAGCDPKGKRLHYETVLRVPEERRMALRRLLLERVPVRRAAIETCIGGSTAYRIRDELAAEMAERGEELPKPVLPGRRTFAEKWLPPQRAWWVWYRQLEATIGHESARAEIERAARATVALPLEVARLVRRLEAGRVLSFEEQLARVRAGAGIVATFKPSRAVPDMTLGGVATAAL